MIRRTAPRSCLRSERLQRILALASILLFTPSAHSNIPGSPEAQLIRGVTTGGHPYLGGGRSFDEQRAIEEESRFYNLKIVFTRPDGTLTSPLFVIIGFNKARYAEKIAVRAPWLFIKLPAGGYTLLARFERDVVLVRDVYVEEGRPRTYVFRGN